MSLAKVDGVASKKRHKNYLLKPPPVHLLRKKGSEKPRFPTPIKPTVVNVVDDTTELEIDPLSKVLEMMKGMRTYVFQVCGNIKFMCESMKILY